MCVHLFIFMGKRIVGVVVEGDNNARRMRFFKIGGFKNIMLTHPMEVLRRRSELVLLY